MIVLQKQALTNPVLKMYIFKKPNKSLTKTGINLAFTNPVLKVCIFQKSNRSLTKMGINLPSLPFLLRSQQFDRHNKATQKEKPNSINYMLEILLEQYFNNSTIASYTNMSEICTTNRKPDANHGNHVIV
jgi:hypothetical protein